MWSASVVTAAPASLPLDIADLRAHCYADPDGADDAELGAYLAAAVDQVQAITGLRLITQSVQMTRARWGCDPIRFLVGPVQSVSLSYLDLTGAAQTVDPAIYVLTGARSIAASLELIGGKAWPQVFDHPAAITCTAQVGFGNGASVPAAILHAIRLLVGDFFANREDTIAERSVTPATLPNGVTALLANYRIW